MLISILFIWGCCYLLFLIFPNFYQKIVETIFNDLFTRNKKIISFGAYLIKNYPFIFGCYVCLSVSTLYIIRHFSEEFWVYILYVLSVCFRNLCILPFLGYSLIIKINERKKKLLFENKQIFLNQELIPLFSTIPLENDKNFCSNFQSWSELVISLQPSSDSSTKIAILTIPTSCFWFITLGFKYQTLDRINTFSRNKKEIESNTGIILKNQDFSVQENLLFQKLAIILNQQINTLERQLQPSGQSLLESLRLYYNSKQAKECVDKSYSLVRDSIDLKFCFRINLEISDSTEIFLGLTKKYLPEVLADLKSRLTCTNVTVTNEINKTNLYSEKNGLIIESDHKLLDLQKDLSLKTPKEENFLLFRVFKKMIMDFLEI